MRKRLIGIMLICLLLALMPVANAQTPALTLRMANGILTLWQGDMLLNSWAAPTDADATIDLYWLEGTAYAEISFDTLAEDAIQIQFDCDESCTLETTGFVSVRHHGALEHPVSPTSSQSAIPSPSVTPTATPRIVVAFPCGLHSGTHEDAWDAHHALQACGQAYECDSTHVHSMFDCGAHFSCMGGDALSHATYGVCPHYVCDPMPHLALDCGIHSMCDADPASHTSLACGHLACDPICDGTLHDQANEDVAIEP